MLVKDRNGYFFVQKGKLEADISCNGVKLVNLLRHDQKAEAVEEESAHKDDLLEAKTT